MIDNKQYWHLFDRFFFF